MTATDGFPEPDNFIDPLANPNSCSRDLPLLKQLGINVRGGTTMPCDMSSLLETGRSRLQRRPDLEP